MSRFTQEIKDRYNDDPIDTIAMLSIGSMVAMVLLLLFIIAVSLGVDLFINGDTTNKECTTQEWSIQ